jgi:nicotinamidase-related amidase
MIQSPLPKPVEAPKAQAAKADATSVDSNIKSPKATMVKGGKETAKTKEAHAAKESKAKEFVDELEANLKEATNPEVKPVHVSAEQALELPSSLVQPSGTVETTSPKVFDPALTKGVEKLVQPKTSEVAVPAAAGAVATVAAVELSDAQVIELANAEGVNPEVKAEIQQAMLKTPQVQSGRSPAIEFAKTEIDPQLLNNEDFVAQKNLVAKKPMPNAYGMKAVPAQQQQALENGLQPVQVVKENTSATNASETPMNSQQFILGLQTEKSLPQTGETHATAKVFDMNNIKSSQPTEIMNQITDYVVQAKAAKEPTVNMRVNHDQLGMIDITVSKVGLNNEAIAVNIGAHTLDGKNFFQQNSKDLFSHLTTAGLNVTDLKVETPTQTARNDFDFGSQAGRNGQHGSEKQFGSEQNQRRHESDRRQDLWKLLNKEAA